MQPGPELWRLKRFNPDYSPVPGCKARSIPSRASTHVDARYRMQGHPPTQWPVPPARPVSVAGARDRGGISGRISASIRVSVRAGVRGRSRDSARPDNLFTRSDGADAMSWLAPGRRAQERCWFVPDRQHQRWPTGEGRYRPPLQIRRRSASD